MLTDKRTAVTYVGILKNISGRLRNSVFTIRLPGIRKRIREMKKAGAAK